VLCSVHGSIPDLLVIMEILGHVSSSMRQGDIQGGAVKSLAQPGRKQATVTKLRIYSTYSP